MDKMGKKNEDLGYNPFFTANRHKLNLDDLSIARIMAEHRGAYQVINADGEFFAKITGKQMFDALSREDYPAVGDWVAITELGQGQAVIRAVLPRKTLIKRKSINKNTTQIIAANIDVAFIVESVDRDYNLNRLERYFSLANAGGIKPVIILNKIDLISREKLDAEIAKITDRFSGSDLITVSVVTDEGLDKLRNYIVPGKTYCFLGSSGVGKSSLINKLLGRNMIKTENISSHTGRGKHATTARAMYFLANGGMVIDNPGMREVGMTDSDAGIDNSFDEIAVLAKKCRYADCQHVQEPGCAVLAELKSGKLSAGRYANYVNLKKEAEYYELTEYEKRVKDRRFGKFVKNVKKELKKYND